jgi:hypothetical protein
MCVAVVRSEMGFSIQNLVAIRARVLSLLFMVALLMDFPIVFAGETLVAGSAVITLFDFEFTLTLSSAGLWHGSCAVARSLVGG